MPIPEMFGRIADKGWAAEHEPKVLSRDPWVVYFDKFLTHEQIDSMMAGFDEVGAKFQESSELSSSENKGRKRRTSDSMFCPFPRCFTDPRLVAVHDVVTNITGLPMSHQELPQVVRYRSGQFYVKHQDTSEEYATAAHGHRIYTFFAYFSDVPDGAGGETHLPKLGIKVKPKKGAAVLWTNVKANNPRREDHRTDHESLPVLDVPDSARPDGVTTKIAANLWLYGYDWRQTWKKGCMNKNIGY